MGSFAVREQRPAAPERERRERARRGPGAAVEALLPAGNRAVAATLQRDVVWTNHPDAQLDAAAKAMDTHVQDSYGEVMSAPSSPLFSDGGGYGDAWLHAYDAFLAAQLAGTAIDAKRLYMTFGYMVEKLACQRIGTGAGLGLPHGWSTSMQVGHGATRPDIVVKDGAGTEHAWFDITSSASTGHIARKQHTGWATRGYVAELTYPALVVANLALQTATLRQQYASIGWQAKAALVAEKKEQRRQAYTAAVSALVPPPGLGADAAKHRSWIETALGTQVFGGARKLSPNVARSVLEELLGTAALADYGYRRADARGRDREGMATLLYRGIDHFTPADDAAFNAHVAAIAKRVGYTHHQLPLMVAGKLPPALREDTNWLPWLAAAGTVALAVIWLALRAASSE